MEKITSFPYTFNLGGTKFEIEDGRVGWINPQGIESKCNIDGQIQNIAIFEDKNEYVMTIEYPDGFYCISHAGGMFGPFTEIKDVKFDADKNVSVISGSKDNKPGDYPLARN